MYSHYNLKSRVKIEYINSCDSDFQSYLVNITADL